MTPAARLQAAIEILDAVIAAARAGGAPAERVVAEGLRARRYAGSGDRRAIREHVFAAIRACGPVPASGRAALLRVADRALFDGSAHGPAPLAAGEQAADGGVAPLWLAQRLAASGLAAEAAEALLGRAALDIRVNAARADRAALALPVAGEALAFTRQGLRLPAGTPVEQWEAYAQGLIEVQDAGSQLACGVVAARPGELVVDLCAGAGGKTLALAADMAGAGRLIACDVDRARLGRLAPRAQRAGAQGIETRLMHPGREMEALGDLAGACDAVLVDAPCSGTGTWRRQPDGRWRLTEKELARVVAIQARLLDLAAGLVKPGGRLVFVTCSVLDEEGADQWQRFLAAHPGWRTDTPALAIGEARGGGVRLSPQASQTDGFFIARGQSLC